MRDQHFSATDVVRFSCSILKQANAQKKVVSMYTSIIQQPHSVMCDVHSLLCVNPSREGVQKKRKLSEEKKTCVEWKYYFVSYALGLIKLNKKNVREN